jgi:hypothetical protein
MRMENGSDESNNDTNIRVPPGLRDRIVALIRDRISPRFVPDEVIAVPGIPTH